jgi:hypothetical protein
MQSFPTKEQFTLWLKTLDQDEVVSVDWTCSSCPIAIYLKNTGVDSAKVYPTSWFAEVGGGVLPDWAKDFVYWVDRINPREVTAEDCLMLLDIQPGPRIGDAHLGF